MYVPVGGTKGYETVTVREDTHIPGTNKKRTTKKEDFACYDVTTQDLIRKN